MKKIFSFILVFTFFSVPVFAQTSTPTLNQVRQQRQEIKQEKKEQLSDLKKQRLEVVYKAIRLGLTKKYESLYKMNVKLEARIAKRTLEGKDMTAAKEKLAGFDQLNTNYKSHLTDFDNKFIELKNSSKPSQLVAGLRGSVNEIKADFKSMRQLLVEVVQLIIDNK